MSNAFNLDAPITASGGGFNLPPISKPRKPFMPPSDGGNASGKPVQNKQASVIPAHVPPSYPKPRAWVEKRVALATRHHARFRSWLASERAKLAAWVQAQPGFDPATACAEARMSEIRRAYRNR